ncbi:MAG: aconitase [Olpidium bornovanus]|uniref:Aconitase n=1 Tax=Olpidium bornovanus TaxID=278681 RepID=A0A8H7ZLW1_9FUNG|nr:MAG: aconitase [Olpidium bornovanus]
MLPLTFADPADYNKISPTDKVSIVGLTSLAPGKSLTLRVHKADGKSIDIPVNHSFNQGQIEWFKAGSALVRANGREKLLGVPVYQKNDY